MNTLALRPQQHHQFETHDGEKLFYRHWPAAGPSRGAILIFHRGHEHSGRMAHLVDELGLADFDFFAWDARGHGQSPGVRGYSPSFGTSVRDIQTFVQHIEGTYGFAANQMAVVAQSVGAVLVSTWLHDYAPPIRGAVLASPAFKVKLYVPFARPGLKLLQALRGNFFVNSYVKAKFLTHDPERIASYDADPQITRPISVNILLGLYEAADRVVADAQAITTPVQLLISGADWVVHHGPQHAFFDRLSSPIKERHVLAGFYHDTLGEKDRHIAVEKMRAFLLARFAETPAAVDLKQSHVSGWSQRESAALAAPLPALSPRGLYWAMNRLSIALGAKLSSGLKLGRETGFDSGSTLDYVYRNQAQGHTPLGRMVDRTYLDAIGWRGIRQRKLNVEDLLRLAFRKLRAAGQPVRVMDVAAGHGRYVLEAIEQGERPEHILLRDYSDINVRDGRALIDSKQLGDIAQFVKADAFDRADLAQVQPQRTVTVVSGLYELFGDNEMIARSLAGIHDSMADGGYLVYTGQPWHPQLEMIARSLTSHRGGAAWVMRRRCQAEMDQLVEAAGFRKLEQRVDEWGIFSVSIAQKVA